jgi:putative heme iron utilization protein
MSNASPPPAFDARLTARTLLRASRSGALSTVRPGSGDPYGSLVNVATAADGAPLLLLSRLAIHTQNLLADPRASLLLDDRGRPGAGDPLQGARISVSGRMMVSDDEQDRRRYLDRQPDAQMFVGFADFAIYRMQVSGAHLVAGFGRIVDLSAGDLLTDLGDAAPLVAAEADIVAHMNADHADTCRLYATTLIGAPDAPWRCVGCDPDGLDLQHAGTGLRLPFPQRVTTPGGLRHMLKALAAQARAADSNGG